MGVGCSVESSSNTGSFTLRTGVNKHPCDICKTERGVHYHTLSATAKAHPNWENDRHMCSVCTANPGELHIHDAQRLFFEA